MDTKTIRVFLLDDHEVVRRGLRDLLESEGDIEIVGESGSAKEAIARIPALRPDVAVLDGRLPDGSGIDVCRQVRSVDPSIKALILTSYDDDEALFAAILAGAAGYVLKQIRGNDLSSRGYDASRRDSRCSTPPSSRGSSNVSATARKHTRSSPCSPSRNARSWP